MKLLNSPTQDRTLLQVNYDKLLHVTGSFMVLVWLSKILTSVHTICIVLGLCCVKTLWNYVADSRCCRQTSRSSILGDWIANGLGFGLWILF